MSGRFSPSLEVRGRVVEQKKFIFGSRTRPLTEKRGRFFIIGGEEKMELIKAKEPEIDWKEIVEQLKRFFGESLPWYQIGPPVEISERIKESLHKVAEVLPRFYKGVRDIFLEEKEVQNLFKQGKEKWMVKLISKILEKKDQRIPLIYRPDVIIAESSKKFPIKIAEIEVAVEGLGFQEVFTNLYYQKEGALIRFAEESKEEGFVFLDLNNENSILETKIIVEILQKKGFSGLELVKIGKLFPKIEKVDHSVSIFRPFNEARMSADPLFSEEELKKYFEFEGNLYNVPTGAVFENKFCLALIHNEKFEEYFERYLQKKEIEFLREVIPYTTVPHWENSTSMLERKEYVIKEAGGTLRAWGGRGLIRGNKITQKKFNQILKKAKDFSEPLIVLQKYERAKEFMLPFFEISKNEIIYQKKRAKILPFYLTTDLSKAKLIGCLGVFRDHWVIQGARNASLSVVF